MPNAEAVTVLVSTLGVSGILAWYLYYTTSVTMPKRDEHYTSSVERITGKFADTLEAERHYREAEAEQLKKFIRDEGCRYNKDHP